MTINEHLKELTELNMLAHTRENECAIGNHIIEIRKHIEEQEDKIFELTVLSQEDKQAYELLTKIIRERSEINSSLCKRIKEQDAMIAHINMRLDEIIKKAEVTDDDNNK